MSNWVTTFKEQAGRITKDLRHRRLIQTALGKYEVQRDRRKSAFQNWESARQIAAETKWEAIQELDKHLVAFTSKLEARGTKVHWATTAAQARDIILGIIRSKKARCIIISSITVAMRFRRNRACGSDWHSEVSPSR